MNLFQIDFVQGKTDAVDYLQVVHSLTDTTTERQIISLSLSSDKLQSISNYMREPKRLSFECFVDDWITDYILSGDYEHERYISHYEVKVYRDDVLIFTGIIDTSNLNHNVADETVSFLCYDKIKLFSLYNDLEQLYSISSGYQPAQILAYFAQKIRAQIPIGLTTSATGFSIPDSAIGIDDAVQLMTIDISEMCSLPASSGGWTYSWDGSGYNSPKYGYVVYPLANKIVFFMGHKKVVKGTFADPLSIVYKGRYKARIIVMFSGLSMLSYEYEDETGWLGELSELSSADDVYLAFFTDKGYPANILSYLNQIEYQGNCAYYCHFTANTVLIPYIWGEWLPSYLHPGKYYETMLGTELTNCLHTLQAMLLLYNATLVADSYGVVQLLSKEPVAAEPVVIADTDVVEISLQRANFEVADMSTLDALCGDTAILQQLAKDYLMAFHGSRWVLSATIDKLSVYAITLGSYIQIKSVNYYVTEVQRDYVADDYKIKGWKV